MTVPLHYFYKVPVLCRFLKQYKGVSQRRLDTYAAHVIVRWTRSDSARVNCMFYIPTSTASFPCQYGLGPRVNTKQANVIPSILKPAL